MKNEKYSFDDFKDIMNTLLGENGCSWDKAQSHDTMKKYLIEECYEVIEAINNKDNENLCEELGDVLLQVVFHCILAEKENNFTIDDVINGISKKMINRHPHIFFKQDNINQEQVLDNWENIKKQEKNYKTHTEILKNIPQSLPSIIRAEKVQKKAADVGFDFQNINEVFDSLYSEIDELKEVLCKSEEEKMNELGDVLFTTINISRFLKINPEFSLTNSLEKFINRFEYIENALSSRGKTFDDSSLKEMNVLWNESKGIKNN